MTIKTTKIRRAWNNKLRGINDLMYWLYDTGVLNKLNSTFTQYYRFYNDGDTPRGVLRKYGISSYDRKKVEEYLEIYLNEFISSILKKYCGKYDKTAFLVWRKNKAIEAVAWRVESGYDVERLDVIKDEEIKGAIRELERRRHSLRSMVKVQNPEFESYIVRYIVENGKNETEDDRDEIAVIESRQKRLADRIRNLKEGE